MIHRLTFTFLAFGSLAALFLASCGSQSAALGQPSEASPSSSSPQQELPANDDTALEDAAAAHAQPAQPASNETELAVSDTSQETATLGAGCFWCIEAVLEQVDGIQNVVSGYMGGGPEAPTYKEVCTGTTDFVEVVQVTFDPQVITYGEVLDWFWRLHDPTTLNRQGNDVGPQYRSVIFTHSDQQAEQARASLAEADKSGAFLRPIVTAIEPADDFHVAEDYHQDYYRGNKAQGYCRVVIAPKLKKLGLEH